ncbi:MAG: exonuclease SbcCD subunit D [Anaerolineae bacterium]
MIKLLHFADLHLGMENYGRLDPQTGLSTRVHDFLAAFDKLIQFAEQESVDLVVFAGDAFKTRDPSLTYQREFARRIRRLAVELGIPTFLLVGNHDLPNASGRAHAIELYDTLQVENVWVSRRPELYRIDTKRGPVQIISLPWVTRSTMLTREESRGLSLQELNDRMLDKLERSMTGEGGLIARLDGNIPAILVAHGSVQGAHYGSERSVLLGSDLILPNSIVLHPAFDYVALGHIHRHQVISESPLAIYPGSMERIDFGEAGEAKGFVAVELAKGTARWQFVDVGARPFVTIRARLDGDDPTQRVLDAIARHDIRNAVVRLVVQGTAEAAAALDERTVRQALEPSCYVAGIIREIDRPARLRLGSQESVEALGPIELLERYLTLKQVPQERRQELLHYAKRIIEEVSD